MKPLARRARVIGRVIVVSLSIVGSYASSAARDGTATSDRRLTVAAVETVGMTVSDMERAVRFYTTVLSFQKVSDVECSGREYELLTGVFGARARVVGLRLGNEAIELTEFLAPKGRPIPADLRANDHVFQHVAIIVSDMEAAYARLRAAGAAHASTGPQLLPAWNPNAGGISAFYFRDPDGHFLEILHFPPGKGQDRWQRADALFLGIDHTAIVVDDTDRSLGFYRDQLHLAIAGTSENYDVEQEHLNNVFGARLRITSLRAAEGPGIELLEYLAPRTGRAAPVDLQSNDLAHWQTTLRVADPEAALDLLRTRLLSLVSPSLVQLNAETSRHALLVRDPDGHGMRLVR
jgi:catechol 2,3-dioxygenase-like lactoylglutathione lyase family enzyme